MARIVLANTPHHVVQRGHNKQVVFAGEDDDRRYLRTLREWKDFFAIKVYAYCLMTNHVYLLLQPSADVQALGLLMKRVSGQQTRYINQMEGRSGTLWESRYKSSPVQTEAYLLACCRYIELNPVRARMVPHPGDYWWSSFRQKTGRASSSWIDKDHIYVGLGGSQREREEAYERYVFEGIKDDEMKLIRRALQLGRLTGDQRFVEEVEGKLGRRLELRGPGRPPKESE